MLQHSSQAQCYTEKYQVHCCPFPWEQCCLSPGMFLQISEMEPLQESPLILTAENLINAKHGFPVATHYADMALEGREL